MLIGTPMTDSQDECEYLYLFPDRVQEEVWQE